MLSKIAKVVRRLFKRKWTMKQELGYYRRLAEDNRPPSTY